jgi:1-deoxy-D-xylulose-5-phosphate reductoisomerase
MAVVTEQTMDAMVDWSAATDIDAVFAADAEARRVAAQTIAARSS